MVLRKLDSHVQKNETGLLTLTPQAKIKMDRRSECKAETTKLEKKQMVNFLTLVLVMIFGI